MEEVCPHGCGQLYPRHLLQTHQLDECPQRPLHLQLESVERRLTQKYELLQQQLLEHLEQQEKKHKEDKKELQQQLAQQEKKHEELQQKHEDQNKKLLQNIVLQEKQENDKHQQLLNQEKKHKQGNKKWIFVVLVVVFGISAAWLLQEMDNTSQQLRQIAERNVELQQQLALIEQLTGTNNALTLHPVGSIGPCDVSVG